MPDYCDVSLPVPLDQAFTYRLPASLQARAQAGCRVTVPFGRRVLTGVIVELHDNAPEAEARDVMRLLDPEPVLDAELMALGRWIAHYYCAPLGEVLRSMTPLSGETRTSRIYTLTRDGHDAVRQLLTGIAEDDPTVQVMRLLERRSLSATHLARKVPGADKALRSLARKGLVTLEEVQSDRDPLRAASDRLEAEFTKPAEAPKLKKAERELLAYLELHPGPHSLRVLDEVVKNGSEAARALARRSLIALRLVDTARPRFGGTATHVLNACQQEAFNAVTAALDERRYAAFLLQGVTGSGKTEIYLQAIDRTLAQGRSALLLVPEIGLTPAMAGQFFHRFGDQVAMLHSAFHDTERIEQWRRIRAGAARVVVATRSGVFAPVRDLGLIIVDEEHDHSYKQAETPRYHGRDVAVMRASHAGAVALLGSATPSLESRHNVERGKYRHLVLPERIEQRPLPTVELVDMRTEFLETRLQGTFSRALLEAISQKLGQGEQVMLLHNRRGFAAFCACRACGERLQCRNCAVTLTWHRKDRRMLCHYCGYAERVPSRCPHCGSEHVHFLGLGAERVEDELHQHFPKARIARMDRDTVTGKRAFESILYGFRDGAYDVLVGTQMIAKGHDIPNVTLVGVVSADIGLGLPDFRAAERVFQLLTQVAGRAGRGSLPGTVLVQTINPEHYAIRMAAAQDYDTFYAREIEFRRLMRYPPHSALANVLVRSKDQEEALRLASEVERFLLPAPADIKVIGPAEAPVPRLKAEFRYQLLVKAAGRQRLLETMHALRRHAITSRWPATALIVDVDPLSLL